MPTPTTSIFLNSTMPAAPAGRQNAKPQSNGGAPLTSVSFHIPNIGGVNAQTGASYIIAASDQGKLVTFSNASAVTIPHPSAMDSGFFFLAENRGAGIVTLTPTTSTIDGASSLALRENQGVAVYSDGTNYFTQRGITAPQPYDVVCSFVGNPSASAAVLILTFARAVSFAGNFDGSFGSVGINPTATATYIVSKNGSSIGTVAISASGVFTFSTTSGAAQSFAAGDRMSVTAPSAQDATLADVAITFVGMR